MKEKQMKYWSNKRLVQEWNDTTFHIRNLGVGRWEIYHLNEVETLLDKRGVMY